MQVFLLIEISKQIKGKKIDENLNRKFYRLIVIGEFGISKFKALESYFFIVPFTMLVVCLI